MEPGGLDMLPDESRNSGQSDIRIWMAQATQEEMAVSENEHLLADDERARAEAFRFPEHRNAFVWSRATLRKILGSLLGMHGRAVQFSYGPRGKPVIDSDRALHFNISHAAGLFVCGATRLGPIGVDVEQVAPLASDAELIAETFFAPEEREQLRAAAHPATAFYQCWTRKEAFLKATGEGLSRDLKSFAVSLSDDCLLRLSESPAEACEWTIASLAAPEGYVGAWAIRMPHARASLTIIDSRV